MFGAFPKIWALGHRNTKNIFEDVVNISEKCDGSQFGFGKIDNQLIMRSKNQQLWIDNPTQMFIEAVAYIKSIEHKIPNNTYYYGEYLQIPKHNILSYDRTPKNHIALFAAFLNEEVVSDYTGLRELANEFDIDVVPTLYEGKIKYESWNDLIQQIEKFLDTTSFLGGTKIEGVVIKNYYKELMIGGVGGQYMPLVSAKYVNEKYKEKHNKNWKKEKTGKGRFKTFCENFCSKARWEKAIIHMREKGLLENEPKDIGGLIREIQNDIIEEEQEFIKNFLWGQFKDDVLRTAIKGFPQWYKEKLIQETFIENDNEENTTNNNQT